MNQKTAAGGGPGQNNNKTATNIITRGTAHIRVLFGSEIVAGGGGSAW